MPTAMQSSARARLSGLEPGRRPRSLAVLLMSCALLAFTTTALGKSGSVIVTAAMRAHAAANIAAHDWAAAQRDSAVRAAARWVAMSDEALWEAIPSQWVPRTCGVHPTAGCPNCGAEFFKIRAVGYDRYAFDSARHPWKLRCKGCKTLFPSNDYGAYYRSGLDDRGEFDPAKADARLLFNAEHPDPADPDHRTWVDDGFGLKVGGDRLTVIAHYTYWLWRECILAPRHLALAYALTGDAVYAHKAAVMLMRFADIYPNIDYAGFVAKNGWGISDGGSGQGMILGKIWETGTATDLSWAYDVIYDALLTDEALVGVAAAMRQRWPGLAALPTTADIARHIEDDMVLQFCQAVLDRRIAGNVGSHQRALATAAIALDRPGVTETYLDWLFAPDGGMIPTILVDLVCRDGPSFEAAPGYSLSPRSLVPVADLLRSYSAYQKHDMYRDYPQMKQIFLATRAFRCLNEVTPTLGDSGKAQHYGCVRQSLEVLMSGYRAYGTPDIAAEAWFSAFHDIARLQRQVDIFDARPQEFIERLTAAKPALPLPVVSANHSGYGLAILQSGSGAEHQGRCATVWYGRMEGSHPHKDRLNLGIFAKGYAVNPDLGYPEFTGMWPKRHGWTSHTVSHNTVLVNDRKQSPNWSGRTDLFSGGTLAQIAIIDGGPPVYEGVTTYRRAVALVDVGSDDSYVVDAFWVRGGRNHRMINNGASRDLAHHGLNLTRQPTGTFAGPEVPYAEFYDDALEDGYTGSGFMYLRDVQRGQATAATAWADWDIVDKDGTIPEGRDPHLRLYMLSPVDEVAVAIGEPPHHRYHEDYFPYVIRSRLGDGLETQFLSVLEPYERTPFLSTSRALPIEENATGGFVAAVEVALADGRRDVVIIAERPGRVRAGGVAMDGQAAFLRRQGDAVVAARLVGGTALRCGAFALTAPVGILSGNIAAIDATDWRDNRITVTPSLLQPGVTRADLVGRSIVVANTARSDACYRIQAVSDDGCVVSLGEQTLIERFRDPGNYAGGFEYTVAPDDAFRVVLSAESAPP
ncbi:MAG: hypothetical protein GX595_03730 [Lentisphaerae bacterium]|nr:hypothetical protein [Lentisphaerota bacterium]